MTRKRIVAALLFAITVIAVLFVYIGTENRRLYVYIENRELCGWNISVPNIDVMKRYDLDHDIINQSKPQDVCDFFTSIPTEWTLNLKKQFPASPKNATCVKLYDTILSRNEVKWVIQPNQTIENLGCTNKTKMCNPAAHFDPVRSIRINTPPCCRQKILFVFEVITTGFRKLNIPHVLSGGGVLGWVRNRKMIPYDEDLDLLVNGTFWKSTLMMQFIDQTCATYGFSYSWITDNWLDVRYSKVNQNGIQLFSYFVQPDGSLKVPGETLWSSRREYSYSMINPPEGPVPFNGIQTFLPNKPVPYLDQYFGRGKWQNEIQCKAISGFIIEGRKCVDYSAANVRSQQISSALFFLLFLLLTL